MAHTLAKRLSVLVREFSRDGAYEQCRGENFATFVVCDGGKNKKRQNTVKTNKNNNKIQEENE